MYRIDDVILSSSLNQFADEAGSDEIVDEPGEEPTEEKEEEDNLEPGLDE